MTKRILEEWREIRRTWGGFWSARVLLTANNYRVFEHLTSPKTAGDVSGILRTDRRATEILLDALTGLGLLKKTELRYRNTSVSDRFLVMSSPYYQGDIIRHADTLWKNWSGLDEVLRTGRPHHIAHDHNSFIQGMHNLAVLKVKKVIAAIGMRGVKKALDLGGGPGTYAMEMARRGISVTLFDRPETVKIARDVISKSGSEGIDFLQGDILQDDIGKGYDLVFISQVLHSCSGDESMQVMEKSREALNPHGRIVIQEFYLEEDKAHPAQSALFSINMLVNTEAGRCYSVQEMKGWLSEAGFRNIKSRIMEDTVLVSGKKRNEK